MIIVWLISACKPVDAPTSHTWDAPPILAVLYEGPGYSPAEYAFSSATPTFVLYADGRVVVVRSCYTVECEKHMILESHLGPEEVCEVLQSIESYGYFDFDMASYHGLGMTDAGTTWIAVNSWHTRTVSAYALGGAINQNLNVPEGLAKTFKRLESFDLPLAKPYRPSRVAVMVTKTEFSPEMPNWPLSTPTLSELIRSVNQATGYLTLEGQPAQQIYDLIGENVMQAFQENGVAYRVTPRPMLPLETWEPSGYWSNHYPFPLTPTTQLTCLQ